ncbi:MAG: hypothetical protein AB8G22_17065 [Saprospiraceae bacterium]
MAKKRKWTSDEEMELEHLYLSLDLSYKDIAKRYNCSVLEIRKKVKELGILQ